jgi:molybdenum cofactor guanylyltransferase
MAKSPTKETQGTANQHIVELCILAGGLSSRMGRDKSGLRLGSLSMLGHIRRLGKDLGMPVRVIKRDIVPRCGPLGGIYTGLHASRADQVLFIACDMPFLSAGLLKKLCEQMKPSQNALFLDHDGLAGFPLLLRREPCLPLVSQQISAGQLSLQALAKALNAKLVRPARGWKDQLQNINTPEEYEEARARIRNAGVTPKKGAKHGIELA